MSSFPRCGTVGFCAYSLWFLSIQAVASNEILTFRVTNGANIQAVVSGLSDGPGCSPEFLPPFSVVVASSSISIMSPPPTPFCFLPLAPTPYQVVADLGVLTGATYLVTWDGGFLVLSGALSPAALAPAIIPALSPTALLALVVCIALLAARSLTRRSTTTLR